jgi:hypothetical protein
MAVIQRGEFVHYANVAKKYDCSCNAVSRRIRALIKSKKKTVSFWQQCLTNKQEEVLIHRINTLTDRGIPPTSYIVKNLIQELKGQDVGKN